MLWVFLWPLYCMGLLAAASTECVGAAVRDKLATVRGAPVGGTCGCATVKLPRHAPTSHDNGDDIMFFWLTALLTYLATPFVLVFGLPVKHRTAGVYLPPAVSSKFPWSSLTPVIEVKPWAWFLRYMDKRGIRGYAMLGFTAFGTNADATTHVHEAIHVVQQSCVSVPVFVLAYLLDWLVFLPWRAWFPEGHWRRAPVAETVAYRVAEVEARE